jgi:hypothetical protein
MEKLKNYIIIGMSIALMIMLLIKGCEKPAVPAKPIYIKGDSTIVIDTVDRPYEVIKFKTKYYPKWDTAYFDTTDTWPKFETSITRFYNDSLSDSNLTIYSKIKVLGIVKESNMSYRLKNPLEVIKTVSRVDTIKSVATPKLTVYGGIETGGNMNRFNISPFLTANVRKTSITFRYGILDKSFNIGVGIRLIKSKH